MTTARALLILGPSFRRKTGKDPLTALERFDGLFFRIARKYLEDTKDIDVSVMIDNLTLIDGTTPLEFNEAQGAKWGGKIILQKNVERSREKNKVYLSHKLKNKKYSEVFISMGKEFARALPDLKGYNINVVFPASGGIGPKALALKEWLSSRTLHPTD